MYRNAEWKAFEITFHRISRNKSSDVHKRCHHDDSIIYLLFLFFCHAIKSKQKLSFLLFCCLCEMNSPRKGKIDEGPVGVMNITCFLTNFDI